MPPVETAELEVTDVAQTNEAPDTSDALAMMRSALAEASPATDADTNEPEREGDAPVAEAKTEGEGEPPKTDGKPTRRAKTVTREVGKVLTESEQKIADAEARATAAEAKAAELEAKAGEAANARTTEQEAARLQQLQAEYGSWIGTTDEYAEAERQSLMDPDAEGWDWERHKAAVSNLAAWKDRRKWAGILVQNAEQRGAAAKMAEVSKDFIDTLSADLPEDKREAYKTHKDGIPGAVRFYAEAIYAPKIEELEAAIAERDAEIERLSMGGSRRSPAAGGPAAPATGLDYSKMTAEEMMSHELREQARRDGRRR